MNSISLNSEIKENNSFFRKVSNIGSFIAREAALIGGSAVCGFLSTYILGELPVNLVSTSSHYLNLSESNSWIDLHAAPQMALIAAATVPIFQISSRILGPALYLDSTRKPEVFSSLDAIKMSKRAAVSYSVKKAEELVTNYASRLFRYVSTNKEALLNNINGATLAIEAAGALSLWSGIRLLKNQEQSKVNTTATKVKKLVGGFQILAGIGGIIAPVVNILKSPIISNEFGQSKWVYSKAVGMASISALGLPIQILERQILRKILSHHQLPPFIRDTLVVLSGAATIGASTILAGYLEFPGVTLKDPFTEFKDIMVGQAISSAIITIGLTVAFKTIELAKSFNISDLSFEEIKEESFGSQPEVVQGQKPINSSKEQIKATDEIIKQIARDYTIGGQVEILLQLIQKYLKDKKLEKSKAINLV